jgi:signal transduction histidine kinase
VTSPLHILLLEDDSGDAELVQELLEAEHMVCEVTRVQTRAEFVAALEDSRIDLILADYKLPSFDGLSALHLALTARPDLPFIFVSGTIGEEAAIESLKIGATDYVLKTRISRLVPSVQRALREARELSERKIAETALRRSEMYLMEAQRLSHTGSFGFDPLTGEIYWSDETYRIFECDPATKPTLRLLIERTHPNDRAYLRQIIEQASLQRREFAAELRLLMPDGSIKYVRAVAHPSIGKGSEDVVLIGAITDVSAHKRVEEERERLRQLEADLARVGRVNMMGELAASLTHEIKQPIAAAVASAHSCTRWLRREAPDLEKACEAASAVVASARRAADIIDRVSSLYRRGSAERILVDLNEIVRELAVLLGNAASRNSVAIGTELDRELPRTRADRVQLQQVLMNLMLNGIEAMQHAGGELHVSSKKGDDGQLLISVTDSGIGISIEETERIFEAFFTTKPQGTGMGLSISRRIIESHGGRLWASPNPGPGATFHFTLPVP